MTSTLPRPVAADTIGYVRVSTEDQASERKSSLAQQRTAIAALAAQLGRSLATVFEDPGVSGGSAERRPGFMALVTYCTMHRRAPAAPGSVLVLNESRWGRFPDPEEAAYWRVVLAKAGWRVRYVEGEAEGLQVRAILRSVEATAATVYRENLKATARRGARGAAARGLWQNEAPIGYRRCAARPGQPGRVLEPGQRKADDEETRLVLGPPAEVALVREAFVRYGAGDVSLGLLCRDLAARWPAKRWSRGVLGALLKNPAYTGDVVWCRKEKLELGHQRRRPASEWVRLPNAHPALVSPALFQRVQDLLARNRRQTSATRGGYPLSGLLVCAQCGQPYVGGGGPKGPAGDPDRYRFYRDSGAEQYNGRPALCPGHVGTLQKRWIEPRVIAVIARVVARAEVQARVAAELDRRLGERVGLSGRRRAELTQERTRLEAERDRLVAAVGRGLLTEGEAQRTLARIRADLDAVTAAAEQLRFAGRRQTVSAAERERLLALAADFAALAARASGAQLRELLRPWLARAIVDKVNRKLVLDIRHVPALAVTPELATHAGPG